MLTLPESLVSALVLFASAGLCVHIGAMQSVSLHCDRRGDCSTLRAPGASACWIVASMPDGISLPGVLINR